MSLALVTTLFISGALAQLLVVPATCPVRNGAGSVAYDFTMASPIYFSGTGNPSTEFSHAQDASGGIKLNLRPHQRLVAAIPLGSTGAYGSASSPTLLWNYDYSIDLTGLGLSFTAAQTAGYTFVIGVDTDPSSAVSLFCYDPIAPGSAGGFDHCFGTPTTGINSCDARDTSSPFPNYGKNLNTYSILQQSWRYSFTGAGTDADVHADGRYEVYLTALLNGVQVARAEASLIVGQTDGTAPGPATIIDPSGGGGGNE
jgi:hypothetical protein